MARINEWHKSSKSAEITGFLDSAPLDKSCAKQIIPDLCQSALMAAPLLPTALLHRSQTVADKG
jgi:hypothetical protein